MDKNTSTKPLLVGESNPYGSDPRYALYPYPENSAGGRLCFRIMDLRLSEYIKRFDRVNLCTSKWSAPAAKIAAREISTRTNLENPLRLVLLGTKVAAAFELTFEPYTVVRAVGLLAVILPHPSGLCRLWGRPGAYDQARAALREAGVL